ncbi:hypothetical protein MML48_9g00004746 [Holotrichia oblita]|uniref:Uncharacterized protein n=1 Tax=Holotrichia oblita TaxID=644536 RepID=A0ACB9SJR4_HOLOL|nr:hypothetical protein MML48_9g00004746 [Holotrichia oblita]
MSCFVHLVHSACNHESIETQTCGQCNYSKNVRKEKKRSVWVREWILRREEFGAYNQLMSELSIEDPAQFSNFLRIKPADFEKLDCKIGPLISKQDTKFRKAISVTERLAVTLRFLASGNLNVQNVHHYDANKLHIDFIGGHLRYLVTGDAYRSLMYASRIHESTISLLIPEVCTASFEKLKDLYLKIGNI